MKRSHFVILFVSILCLAFTTQAQPRRDAQALAILAQAQSQVAATPAQDSVAEGTITWGDGRSGTIRLKTKGTSRFRYETTVSSLTTVYVVNGRRGQVDSDGTRHKAPLWVTAYQKPQHIPVLSRLGDFQKANMNVDLVGTVDVNGRPAYQIRFTALPTDNTPPEIEEMISDYTVFLDSQSLLPVKTLSYDYSPEIIQNRTLVETYFSDYRFVDGVPVAHRVTRFIRGEKVMETVLSDVRLNVGLSDAEFAVAGVN